MTEVPDPVLPDAGRMPSRRDGLEAVWSSYDRREVAKDAIACWDCDAASADSGGRGVGRSSPTRQPRCIIRLEPDCSSALLTQGPGAPIERRTGRSGEYPSSRHADRAGPPSPTRATRGGVQPSRPARWAARTATPAAHRPLGRAASSVRARGGQRPTTAPAGALLDPDTFEGIGAWERDRATVLRYDGVASTRHGATRRGTRRFHGRERPQPEDRSAAVPASL